MKKPTIHRNGENGKKVIDNNTGLIYNSLTQVLKLNNVKYKYSTLRAMLNGQNPNKTNFEYVAIQERK